MSKTTLKSILREKTGTIALDCDGVILDFVSAFKNTAENALGRKVVSTNNTYDIGKRFGLTKVETAAVFDTFYSGRGWANLPPLPGAVDSCQGLIESGQFRVVIVTAIDEKFLDDRIENLESFGIFPEEVYCVGTDSNHSKSDAYIKEQPIAVVDDRLHYLMEARDSISARTPELVWINDGINQNGLTSEFVNFEVKSLFDWTKLAIPLADEDIQKSLVNGLVF